MFASIGMAAPSGAGSLLLVAPQHPITRAQGIQQSMQSRLITSSFRYNCYRPAGFRWPTGQAVSCEPDSRRETTSKLQNMPTVSTTGVCPVVRTNLNERAGGSKSMTLSILASLVLTWVVLPIMLNATHKDVMRTLRHATTLAMTLLGPLAQSRAKLSRYSSLSKHFCTVTCIWGSNRALGSG